MPTRKQVQEWSKRYEEEQEALRKKWAEEAKNNPPDPRPGISFDPSKVPPKRCDSPYTMEDSTATVLWIVAMLVSPIFVGGWAIGLIATIIWRNFVTRYKKK